MSTIVKKNEIVKDKVLQFLEETKVSQSRVAILCAVYGFRFSAGNILSWSIYERQLLQQKKIDKATKLLKDVVNECEETGLQKNIIRTLDNLNRFDLVEGNPMLQEKTPLGITVAAIQSMLEETYNSLALNVKSDPSNRLQKYLKYWTWRIWQRHTIERHCANSVSVIKEKNEAQVNIFRALKSLQEEEKIKIEGTRKQMLISLLEPI